MGDLSMRRTLFKLQEQGASIVPIIEGKRSIKGWSKFGKKALTKDELEDLLKYETAGYGIMMGYGGFYSIDIDAKNMPDETRTQLFPAIWNAIPERLRSELTVERTPNGGEHLIYKCAVSASQYHSVKNPATGKPVLEVLSSNQYLKIYPSQGYQVATGSLEQVHEILVADHYLLRDTCCRVAESFFKTDSKPKETAEDNWDRIMTYECDDDSVDDDDDTDADETSKLKPGVQNTDTFRVVIKGLPDEKPRKKEAQANAVSLNSRAAHFISSSAAYLESSGKDITSNYDEWRKSAYSIANEMGEDGREHFHKVSANYPEYDEEECDKMYDGILKSISNNDCQNPATGASFRYIMDEHGIQIPKADEENKTAFKTQQAIAYVRGKGLYRNAFTNKIETNKGEPLTDSDFDTMFVELRTLGYAVSKSEVGSIINSRYIRQVNPLLDYLKDAEKSANNEALEALLDCLILKTDDPEKQRFYRGLTIKWLLQIPAMILDEQMPRLVLVLIGGTYIGKSEFFRRLLPEKLNKYYAESALDRDKDSDIMMTENLLINVDELAGIMKSSVNVEKFKSLSSAINFNLRTPYGKVNERFQRKAILCGTSNKIDVIQDHDAGNSRIIPLELTDINKELYNSIDRDALFGVLVKLYREMGFEALRLTPEELDSLKSESGEYTTVNVELELIQRYFRPGGRFMSTTEICDYITGRTNLHINPKHISREMNKDGRFTKKRERIDGSHRNGFLVEEISPIFTVEDMKQLVSKRQMSNN